MRRICLNVPVQPTPISLHRLQDHAAFLAVLERLCQHRSGAVGRGHVKACAGQPHGVEAGSGCDIEHGFLAAGAQHVHEELSLAVGARVPVDQLVPLFHERHDVFAAVEIRFPVCDRIPAISLLVQLQFGIGGQLLSCMDSVSFLGARCRTEQAAACTRSCTARRSGSERRNGSVASPAGGA